MTEEDVNSSSFDYSVPRRLNLERAEVWPLGAAAKNGGGAGAGNGVWFAD